MADPSAPSPPKGLTSSPSIFAYQTRILQRTTSTRQNTTSHSHSSSTGLTSLAALANSPPSTPIRQNVAKMANNFPSDNIPRSGSGLGLGMGGKSAAAHGRNGRSVDLVRGQWEAKINEASTVEATPVSKRSSMFSPPLVSSSTFSTVPPSPPVRTPSVSSIGSPSDTGLSFPGKAGDTPISGGSHGSSYSRGIIDLDAIRIPETPSREGSTIRARPPSVSSYTSVLSPTSTGSSSVASNRSQQVEDTLAQARANALKRLEARKKAKAEASGEVYVPPSPALDVSTITRTLDSTSITPVRLPETPVREPEAKKASPFANLFAPPTNDIETTPTKPTYTSNDSTPTSHSTRASYRSIVNPPSASSGSSRYVPSGLSAANNLQPSSSGSTAVGGNDKYGSISRTDKRRLGRHLPRIASGEGGWEEEEGRTRVPSGRERVPSTLGKSVSSTEEAAPAAPARTKAEPLTPSSSDNRLPPASPTATKRRSGYLPQTPKGSISAGTALLSPRAEVVGEEMKGLMSAVGALPSRGVAKDDGEGVTGMYKPLD
jgi:Ras GTPase-activating-like protein IQGAP2/3